MAVTLQIKRSTGSSAPGTLADGELAYTKGDNKLYIGDGSLMFNNTLNREGGYYISTNTNALNAGPVSLGSTMTLDGTWVIV